MTALKSKKLFALLVVMLVMVITFSMLQLNVFADGSEGDTTGVEDTGTEEGGETGDVGGEEGGEGETPEVGEGESTEDAPATGEESGDTTTDTPATTDTTDTTDTTEKQGIQTSTIVTLIICGVLLVVAVVLIVKNRVKVVNFLGSLKSEIKKIKWTKRKDVIKFSAVALSVIAICAVVIGLLDFAFSKGIIALGTIF